MMYPFYDPKLPLKERIKDLISRLTIDEKIGFIPTHNHAVERLGITEWSFGGEGAHGFVNREGKNTTFPQTIGLAAGWDRDLMRRIGKVVGTEARVYYKANSRKRGLEVWSPTIDLERDPRWGRTEEGYGEDPFLTSELSCEYIKGVQGDDPFYLRASCGPKHFFANNNEENRCVCSCSIPARMMHEYYLVPFKNAIQRAGATSMMTAYNEVNGIPMMLHPLLKETVKNDWGFEGHMVTDGGDFLHTVDLHHYFETHGETLAAALKNGADNMTDMPEGIISAAKEALERNLICEADLDEHLERILTVRFRFGQFDPPELCPFEEFNETDSMKEELALEAVKKSVVLLKNDNTILPLRPGTINETIAVMSLLADDLHLDWYSGRPAYSSTPLNGLKEIYGDKIEYTDCRDIVSFTTEDGRPLILIDVKGSGNTGNSISSPEKTRKTLAAGSLGENATRFYMEDWGWGAKTFTDVESGLMLQGCYGRREVVPPRKEPVPPEAMPSNTRTEFTITADGINNLGWFGFTLFNIVPQEGGDVLLKTHDNRCAAFRETNVPVIQHDDPIAANGELFRMKIEKDGLASACEAASKAGHVIIFAGNDPMINGRECVDRPGLNLPARQEELIRRTAEINPKTILVLLSGYPYSCKEIAKKVPAILWMAHGIQETGNGIANIISGGSSPAGRTPLTWYENEKQLPQIMEYDIQKGASTYQYFSGKVLWPFGHGLSYVGFEYSQLKIDKTAVNKDEIVNVTFNLKNTGSVSSEEVPQMYITFSGSSFYRPLKTLKGFSRLSLTSGEEKIITFELQVNELSIWDSFKNCFIIESGYCSVLIGASSLDIRLSGGFNVIRRKSSSQKNRAAA
ncbi:MAG: glycoside hydrolase family 3 C-terminal domain-containing protein [Treponema sp.]|nr:glycoside hydrolase family 3 C-terminal domain-containing protein [Treponema sp.]